MIHDMMVIQRDGVVIVLSPPPGFSAYAVRFADGAAVIRFLEAKDC